MKEATLPKAYVYGRKLYTPDDKEIPDELYDVLVEAGVLAAAKDAEKSSRPGPKAK